MAEPIQIGAASEEGLDANDADADAEARLKPAAMSNVKSDSTNTGDMQGAMETATDEPERCIGRFARYMVMAGIAFLIAVVSFYMSTQIQWVAFSWRIYVGVGILMLLIDLACFINYNQMWRPFTAFFATYTTALVVLFFVLALADFILLGLSDKPAICYTNPNDTTCPVLDPDTNGVRYVTRTLTIIVGFLFTGCVLAYWQQISLAAAQSSWLQSVIYFSVIGYVVMVISRWMENPPPKEGTDWSWHQEHPWSNVLNKIVKLMILWVVFFVFFGAIILAVFADVVRVMGGSVGTIVSILIFSVLAFILMITPLAPGSVVDVCAGFLFVNLFVNNDKLSVPNAFLLALAITVVLHFIGSCLQYYVGKMRAVQIWANQVLPLELLAASESVLRTAGWFKVGMVGQVFMDTMNGLNQGRMNMAWCTQFWAEYSSFPTALSLVALGTILAIPSFDSAIAQRYQWAEQAVPLALMLASVWQIVASSWGASQLLMSASKSSYWTALEKWAAVQYFWRKGYVASTKGWEQDVFRLATDGGLFEKIAPVKMQEKQESSHGDALPDYVIWDIFGDSCCWKGPMVSNPTKSRKRIMDQIQFNRQVEETRQEHFEEVEQSLDELFADGLLCQAEIEEPIISYFDRAQPGSTRYIMHFLIVALIYVTGGLSYLYIARPVSLAAAVQQGIGVLSKAGTLGWVSFAIFWVLVSFYYYIEILDSLKTTMDSIVWMFCSGCAVEEDWETVFDNPEWIAPSTYKSTANFIDNTPQVAKGAPLMVIGACCC